MSQATQLRLVSAPGRATEPARRSVFGDSIEQRFDRWVHDNPQVWELFVRFARELRASGLRRAGAKLIVERIRFEVAVKTVGDDFKLNNDFTSRLARRLVLHDPSFDGFFEFRELKS